MKKRLLTMIIAISGGLTMMTAAPVFQAPVTPQTPDTVIGVVLVTPVTMEVSSTLSDQMKTQQAELVNGWEIIEVDADQTDTLVSVGFMPADNGLDAIQLGLNDSVLFQTGSAMLSPKADKVLSKLAANLQNFPETDVTIVGYASHTGNAEDNLDLSMQRAQNVMDYLVKQGVDATRMKAIGKGWTNPVATNMTAAGRADNRRVEIWITPNQQMIDEAQ
ncbi:MAG: OmpA family protein [Bacteroidales bacterium]